MAIYSIANRITGVASGSAALEIRTTSTDRPRIMQIELFLAAATASTFGLGRPAAIGVTPTTPKLLLAEDPGDPVATVQTALAWATPPTSPVDFFRRIALPATIGTGIIWTFPRGLIIPVSSSLVIWNLAANGVADINVIIDE
jgi:hypothetical protein